MSFDEILGMAPALFRGLLVTVELFCVSAVSGLILAVLIALMRVSSFAPLRIAAAAYILFFRGTPVLVQLFIIYYGTGQFPEIRQTPLWFFLKDAYFCAWIGLTLNTAGYTAEILRGAFQAVPKGEIEAAYSVGMKPLKVFRRIVMPNAFRSAWAAYGNEVIFLLKSTAVVFTISVVDLMGAANQIRSVTYRTYEPLLFAGLLYLVVSIAITAFFEIIQKRFRKERRQMAGV